MRRILMLSVFFLSSAALASEGVLTASAPSGVDLNKASFTEVGFQASSINNGTRFASLALGYEFNDWFIGVARGLVPMEYSRDSQTYAAQLAARFALMNGIDVVYLEAQISQGLFSSSAGDPTAFAMLGANYGYSHRFSGDFTAGVNLGVDWSTSQISRNQFVARSTIVNHIGLSGGYYF